MRQSKGRVVREFRLVPDVSPEMEVTLRTFIEKLRHAQRGAESISCNAELRLDIAGAIRAPLDALETVLNEHATAWRILRTG